MSTFRRGLVPCLMALVWVALVWVAPALATPLSGGVPESFVFQPTGPFAGQPLKVFYYKPAHATAQARVLFVVHGVERDAARARDNWVDAAERHGVIVLAPEFDQARFPNRLFQQGGIEARDPAGWTFQLIEALFDQVRHDEGLTASTYDLFGHSAGAQFVHRLALMAPQPRLGMAVAANAGTYTFAAYAEEASSLQFPWALDASRLPPSALKERFERRLVILLGDADLKTTGEFPSSAPAMAQGDTRLARGRHFCEAAQRQARALRVPLQWRCIEVPGVGHNSRKMSQAAVALLFGPP